mmetsp:Transcript_15215/g.30972  ORF Transcript_15215/g.30972 Transcript_15215/m.30972 type:complete len:85 (-) Transcript_15215:191-445(-)
MSGGVGAEGGSEGDCGGAGKVGIEMNIIGVIASYSPVLRFDSLDQPRKHPCCAMRDQVSRHTSRPQCHRDIVGTHSLQCRLWDN